MEIRVYENVNRLSFQRGYRGTIIGTTVHKTKNKFKSRSSSHMGRITYSTWWKWLYVVRGIDRCI